ncbi:hypothetical protein evm_013466 [Chilo suppressalis]|nr:hypothetical protein evm_013466 [Chilo suppressalis]
MSLSISVVFCALIAVATCQSATSFPPGFQFGTGTSSYQVEGGWNASDKGEHIWDRMTHDHPDRISDGSNGDVACDSYHQWQRDVEMAAELGLDFYRFSISWSRVLPTGFANYVSEDGKNYYNKLIDGLLEKGIEPMITIYHWELPMSIQDLGGWANPLIVDWFGDYARVLYSLYGDRVKTWLTINEATVVCDFGYGMPAMAPDVTDPIIGKYLCSKHIVLAHAKAWRIYDEEFKGIYNGRVSLANHMLWLEARKPEDEEVAELARQLSFGLYAHPIFTKEGGYPPAIEKLFAEVSLAEGYPTSRLPPYTKEEIEFARGTYDYLGMNQYTSRAVRRAQPGEDLGSFPLKGSPELNIILEMHPDATATGSAILPSHPESLRRSLVWIKQQYGDQEVIITENGHGSNNVDLDDDSNRINYYKRYLEQLLLAIHEDGVKVTGYSAWSMMDNFEWTDGYQTMFGLYHVNFSDPERTRTPRQSARYYASVIKARSLDVPDTYE